MEFEDNAREIVENECEDYFFGIVDLSMTKNMVICQFKSLISEYPRAISVGITLPYKITYGLKNKTNAVYHETSCKLNRITEQLNDLLEQNGYKALSLPNSRLKDIPFTSLHAVIANLADLGWMEEGILITPEVGSSVNWGTVLTDAPIKKPYK